MMFFSELEDTTKVLKRIEEYLKSLKKGKVQIEIKKVRAIRSLQQNALYWMWLSIISNDTGFTPDELHTTFRSMFLTDHSQRLPVVRSTTVLNKIQFGLYLDKIEREAGKMGIILPVPDQY